jgi:hypothetical protein
MPKGTSFNMTEKRKARAIDMLRNQYSVGSIATEFGIGYKTLLGLFKKEKMDHKAIRMSGLNTLRADTFRSIGVIKDDSKRVKAGLEFLDRYPIQDDEVDDEVKDSGNSDEDIAKKILLELSVE